MLLRDHGDDIAVAAERWLLEALVSWAAAQDRHSAGHGPSQRSGSGGEEPGSPSRWHAAADGPHSSQAEGGSVRGGNLWRGGSGGEPGGERLRADDTPGEQEVDEALVSVGTNRAAHVGAVAAPLLEHVRWELLPDAPTGAAMLHDLHKTWLPCQ